jgi:hypothetical protein
MKYRKGKFVSFEEVPECLDKAKVQELTRFQRQIEREHESNNKTRFVRVHWLLKHRNWFVQQNKNPSSR